MPPSGAPGVAESSPPPYIDAWAQLALRIDTAMREKAPAGWKGDVTKERTIQNFLHPLLDRNGPATLALFEIIKNQPGY
jgi:type I restriction enzyme R subunit